MLIEVKNRSQRAACKAVGLARSTYRRTPLAQTADDPDADLRAWLRSYATKHPCHGFRRAWAALRHDEGAGVNKKKVHRLWREEGLQVKARSPRKRAGMSTSHPPRSVHIRQRPQHQDPRLHRRLERTLPPIRVDQNRRPDPR
jgi:hypothetical protein